MPKALYWINGKLVSKSDRQAKKCQKEKHMDKPNGATLRYDKQYGLFQSCNTCGACFA